ncbi:MAG: hypothetical protein Tsb0019_24450 [Roseibium sp.]
MSFRLKTILGIALIEIVVLGILVATSIHDLRTSNQNEIRTRAQTTAKLLATMTSDAVVSLDLATLDVLVAQALLNDGLEYVQIRNADGLVLAHGGSAEPAAELPDASPDATVLDAEIFNVTVPIDVGGAKFGSVQIGLSTSLLNDVIAAGTRRMLTIAGLEVLLVALFGYLLGTVLTRQLKHLRDGAARVATGDFGYHMPVRGNDELASTARSFNKMSAALAEYDRITKSERDEAEAGRRFAETLLVDAINSVSNAVFIVAENGELRFVNRAAADLYHLGDDVCQTGTRFENVLLTAYAVAPAAEADRLAEIIQDRLDRLERGTVQSWQSTWLDNRVLLHTQRPIVTGGFVMVDTDVTELYDANEKNRRLELELMETHKLESLGTLASGVAHEINTPTQFIGDNLKFLREAFTDIADFVDAAGDLPKAEREAQLADIDWSFLKDEIPAALSEAAQGVESIGKIVRSIKEFAHPDDSECTETDLVKLIENAATVSRSQWRHNADLMFAPDCDEMIVPCYPGDISQVVINLIVNAADAIAEHTQKQGYSGGKGEISIDMSRDDTMCTIRVRDNGPGIDAANLRRIFDMFFTTKPPGKGTGQGLAICKSIVEIKHHGKLDVDSRVGEGSTFLVRLPLRPVVPGRSTAAETRAA